MTVEEKLIEELRAAIKAVFGDEAEKEFDEDSVAPSDIDAIARKAKFYMFE